MRTKKTWDSESPAVQMAAAGQPHARVVLLKSSVEALRETSELCFFTNYNSPKSRELANEPRATLVFYWSSLARQVRVEGRTRRCSEQESDEYFASRPRGHQIGAWASAQSEPITSRDELIARVTELEAEYAGREVPRPPHWGGFLLAPEYFEFWQGQENRLHDRFGYRRHTDGWTITRLAP